MSSKRAFTLIELLTVIAVIAILGAILIPTIGSARERAAATKSFSNLRQIYAATQMYANENNFRVPYAYFRGNGATNTWYQFVAPYMSGERGRAEGGTFGAAYIANDALRCPRWEDSPSYNPDHTWKTGYGMNYFLMRPQNGDRNIHEPNNEGERGWQSDVLFSQIPFPSTTILIGNSADFHLGSTGVEETDRWGTESHVLYADGRVASVTPEIFYRNWADPSDRP